MRDLFKSMPLIRSVQMRRSWLTLLFTVALPALYLAVSSWITANTTISRDQWHFMPMVNDYFAGHFHLFSLWETHSQHRTPGYKLLFLLNAIFFKLNMRLEIMTGYTALAASVLLLLKRFRDSLPPEAPNRILFFGVVTLALLGFNLNQWYCLTYSLTSLAGYGSVLCFVWLWLMLDSQLREGTGTWQTAGLCLVLAFTLISFAAGMGPALIVTMLAVPAATMLLERRTGTADLRLLAALAVTALVCEWLYWFTPGVVRESPHTQPFMQVLVIHPLSVLQFLVLSFATSTIPTDAMEGHFHALGHDLNLMVGVIVMGAYALSVSIYLHLRLWRFSYLPGFLMAFALLFILSTLIVRLPSDGVGTSEAPRYVLYSQLGLVGCAWALYLWAATAAPSGKLWRSIMSPGDICIAAILLYAACCIALWTYRSHAVSNNAIAIQEVRNGDFTATDWVCGDLNLDLCKAGRTTLEQYALNVFADQPLTSPTR